MREKNRVFGKCEKCIGITPCKILSNGKAVCEYCGNEVDHFDVKHVVKVPKGTVSEHRLET